MGTGPDSDVDLLVDFDLGTQGVTPLIQLQRELAEMLGEQIDIATEELLREKIARRAADEAVPLRATCRGCASPVGRLLLVLRRQPGDMTPVGSPPAAGSDGGTHLH